MKHAFTLIELIITMVILSIVAYISSGLIAKTYIGYNQTNVLHKANIKIEIALNSIANRLEYAIDGTVVKRKSESDPSIAPINQAPTDYNVLEWVGYAKDSFNANKASSDKPGWSGFCDIKNSDKNHIITKGSDLDFANKIINRLSYKKANFNNDSTVAIFFPGNFNYTNIGYNGSSNSGVALINGFDNTNSILNLSRDVKRITEHYKLAWSAYAVVPKNYSSDNTFDLYLRYNFRPWKGEDYNTQTVVNNEKLLATNVSVFKTFATENRIHIKICIKEKIGANRRISICKEKVVFK